MFCGVTVRHAKSAALRPGLRSRSTTSFPSQLVGVIYWGISRLCAQIAIGSVQVGGSGHLANVVSVHSPAWPVPLEKWLGVNVTGRLDRGIRFHDSMIEGSSDVKRSAILEVWFRLPGPVATANSDARSANCSPLHR